MFVGSRLLAALVALSGCSVVVSDTSVDTSIRVDGAFQGSSVGGTLQWTHFTSALDEPSLLLVGIAIRGEQSSEVLFGDEPLTLIGAETDGPRSELWVLPNPAAGESIVLLRINGESLLAGGSVILTGVDEARPYYSPSGSSGDGLDPASVPAVEAGDLAIATITTDQSTQLSLDDSIDELWSITAISNDQGVTTTGVSSTQGSATGQPSGPWTMSAVVVRATE